MTTWTEKTQQAETWTSATEQAESWTPKTEQGEMWTGQPPNVVGAGFSQGFAPRPHFQIAYRNGIWTVGTEQSETWTAA